MIVAKRSPEARPGRSIVFFSSDSLPEVHHLSPHADTSKSQSTTYLRSPSVNKLLPRHIEFPTQISFSSPCSSSHQQSSSPPRMAPTSTSGWQPAVSPYTDLHSPPKHRLSYSVELTCFDHTMQKHKRDVGITITTRYMGSDNVSPIELEATSFRLPANERVGLGHLLLKVPEPFAPQSCSPVGPSILSDERPLSTADRCSVGALLNRGD